MSLYLRKRLRSSNSLHTHLHHNIHLQLTLPVAFARIPKLGTSGEHRYVPRQYTVFELDRITACMHSVVILSRTTTVPIQGVMGTIASRTIECLAEPAQAMGMQ